MDYKFVMGIQGISGESVVNGYQDQIDVISIDFACERQQAGTSASAETARGPVDVRTFYVRKRVDRSSPSLFVACCSGRAFSEICLYAVTPTDDPTCAMTYVLENAIIVSFRVVGEPHGLFDEVGICSERITMQRAVIDTTGRPQGTVVSGWDFQRNDRL